MNSADEEVAKMEKTIPSDGENSKVESSASSESASPPPLSRAPRHETLEGWRLFVVEAVLCLGLLLSVMESSIVATALVTIGTEFNDFIKVTWTVLSYLLSYMGLAIVFARLSDVVGRKWAVMAAWLLFTAFSLACGFSTSLNQLIAFRTLQGVGGSGLYTLTMVVVPEISPPRFFAIMSGCVGAVFSVSGVLGPVLGGVITEKSSWRWIFWLNSPFGLTAMIILLLSWPSRSVNTNRVKLSDVDWLGACLLLAASVLLVFGLQQGGSTAFSWSSAGSIVVFVLSAVSWVSFALWITFLHKRHQAGKSNRDGIFPIQVITRGKMLVVIFTTFLTGFSFILVLIYLPERFQIVHLKDPVQAGVNMLPMLCFTAVGSAIGGLASSKRNFTFWTLSIGNALVLLGCGLFTTVELTFDIPAHEYAYQILFGLGVGMTFATATVMCVLESRHQDLAVAQGLINQARVLGGAIGLAIATIVLNSLASSRLTGVLTPEELSQLLKSPQIAYQFTLDKQIAVREVFGRSFNDQLKICTYIAAVAFAASILAYSRHPVDTLKRKAEHDAWMRGEIGDEE